MTPQSINLPLFLEMLGVTVVSVVFSYIVVLVTVETIKKNRKVKDE